MQKDTVIHSIHSVLLDPTRTNKVVTIPNIRDVVINGQSLGVGGYVDIGIIDTMKDLFVNFIGAVVFSVTGFFSTPRARAAAGRRPRGSSPAKTEEQDYLEQARKETDLPEPEEPC